MGNANDEEKEPAFKVVDRRRFTEEGDARREVESEDSLKKNAEDISQDHNFSSSSTNKKLGAEFDRSAISFSLFVQTLSHQAMMGLGIFPWPDSGLIKVDLMMAQETIDILQMLKEKTVGNTTKDEQSLLENLLYQLQVAFVEISQKKPASNEILKK